MHGALLFNTNKFVWWGKDYERNSIGNGNDYEIVALYAKLHEIRILSFCFSFFFITFFPVSDRLY